MEELKRSDATCESCGTRLQFLDAVQTTNGPINIYKCTKCDVIYWQEPPQEPKA